MSYPEHSLGESYLSAEMQSVYSTASRPQPNGLHMMVFRVVTGNRDVLPLFMMISLNKFHLWYFKISSYNFGKYLNDNLFITAQNKLSNQIKNINGVENFKIKLDDLKKKL